MVLANPEIAKLPNWVVALVAAGGLAAALSTAAGLLLVISSAISHDLIKKQLKPDISDHAELIIARIAAGGAVILAGHFGVNPPDYVAATVAFAFGLLHGFGFASGLSTTGMPKAELPWALLWFNVGVEIGQLVFVFLALALAWSFRTLEIRWPRWAQAVPGYTVGSLGAYWTIQRTVILLGGVI